MRLKGKNAIVTGGATGIGNAIARALAREGCQIVLAGRREGVLRESSRDWDAGPLPLIQSVDVADRESVARLFTSVAKHVGTVDILVNAAGVNVAHRSLETTLPEEWDRILTVNATGTYNCMRAVLPSMKQQGEGLIVNISSVAGLRADTLSGVAYISSKFAMSALGAAAALEYGKHGIRVTTICPGDVDTPLLADRAQPPTREQRAQMLQPEDIGEAVRMIACLPQRAHVVELIIKPVTEDFA